MLALKRIGIVLVVAFLIGGCAEKLDKVDHELWSIQGYLPSENAAGKPRPALKLDYRLSAYENNWFDLEISVAGKAEISRYALFTDSPQNRRDSVLVDPVNPAREGPHIILFEAEPFDRLILEVDYTSGKEMRKHTFSIPVKSPIAAVPSVCDEPRCYTDSEL